jgi:hypothetical protein
LNLEKMVACIIRNVKLQNSETRPVIIGTASGSLNSYLVPLGGVDFFGSPTRL